MSEKPKVDLRLKFFSKPSDFEFVEQPGVTTQVKQILKPKEVK